MEFGKLCPHTQEININKTTLLNLKEARIYSLVLGYIWPGLFNSLIKKGYE
jgi:hypothetical protein